MVNKKSKIEPNRMIFVDNIEQEIKNNSQKYFNEENGSLIFSINGKWGEGKTTLKEELKSSFLLNENYKVINFDNWNFSNKNNTFEALFFNIYNNFDIKKDIDIEKLTKLKESKKEKISDFKTFNFLEKMKNITKLIGNFILNHPLVSFIVIFFLSYEFDIKNKITELSISFLTIILSALFGIHKLYDSILNKKDFLKPLIENGNKKFIVFIDDIDRLSKQEIRDLFRIIKTNLDIKNIIYILFYSKDIVAKAVSEDYFDGYEFLEKIINYDLSLPKISCRYYSILFFKELSEYIDNKKYEDIRYFNENYFDIGSASFIKYENKQGYFDNTMDIYFSNFRKLYRFSKNFRNYIISPNTIACFPICLFCLSILKINEPCIHDIIKNNKNKFLDEKFLNKIKELYFLKNFDFDENVVKKITFLYK